MLRPPYAHQCDRPRKSGYPGNSFPASSGTALRYPDTSILMTGHLLLRNFLRNDSARYVKFSRNGQKLRPMTWTNLTNWRLSPGCT
ncbi:hypothetical protein ATT79_08635 [Salmonella enterica subsp. enterica serovar Panama]|uniref:Uncharacterized protein n=1 Tax=Salmonella enterica subsp. enterica serovar Panama TaxID=29472 RepID=A0A619AB56_SALET|nr:hypothetical protein [Salmonella enterica subsp. enterica serovar Panama]ECX6033290.1 hypothetical protein [Salmonella enterica subsp. enterica serovar Panama]EGU5382104.1 hypothetical protein [Salmonella enterica]EGX1717174.1 hypothetical protein [Salmonella enterica subsp. enterica serovar Panama]